MGIERDRDSAEGLKGNGFDYTGAEKDLHTLDLSWNLSVDVLKFHVTLLGG